MSRLVRAVRLATITLTTLCATTAVIVIAAGVPAEAQVLAAPPQDLDTVINNITKWLVGLLVALATLFLTVGGIRYLLAGGDPGEVGKAGCGREKQERLCVGLSDGQGSAGAVMSMRFSDGDVAVDR